MSFCTAVNCMDGRVQLPVIHYLRSRYGVDYVDTVSEPGPNAILANATDRTCIESIERRVRISVEKHKSVAIAVIGHHDCAGNPVGRDEQTVQTRSAMARMKRLFLSVPVVGLWVDEAWAVSEIDG